MDDPHSKQPVKTVGTPLDDAAKAVVLLHGRGATAESILRFADNLSQEQTTFLAPQAANRTWYPHPFLNPVSDNQPFLDSALSRIATLLDHITGSSISLENVFIGGFSQGACLATEYAARNAQRYGGVFAFSGGLIGDTVDRDRYSGDLAQTPVFLGCSDQDPHIPLERVESTAEVMTSLNGTVDKRIYEGMGHTVNDDEISAVRNLLQS